MAGGVRELTRDAVRAHLAESVFDHFLAYGFAHTTVEDAAKAAGISRATFFRYFASKEDAVIAAVQASQLDFGSRVTTPVLREGEPSWSLLRRAFEPMVDAAEAGPVRVRAKAQMIASIPSLRSLLANRRSLHEDELVRALGERESDPLTAKVLVVAALSAFDLAWREWAADPDASLRDVLDGVFSRLADHFAGDRA